ncbi:MAG: helix-turn-helix transcriptional regulator [Lachnospiraceae bacterium]|nr:helix-turn-helix transcriptional regulator [Lachnospiraceae bacterium]
MAKKTTKKTKSKIVSAAWKLFYDQGYEDTTIEEIIEESGTSKGSFYHYFEGKDALLGSLSYMFDEKYEELEETLDGSMTSYELLLYLNKELFVMIEKSVDIELLGRLFSTQLITKGQKYLMDYSREYYKLLRRIITEGKEKGELTDAFSTSEMVRYYALCERGIMYDWCLASGEYSLSEYSARMLPLMLDGFLKKS